VPSLHNLRLDELDASHVIKALDKIWRKKPISANRTRERIEKLLDAAKVENYRTGDNSARWRGNLSLHFTSARKLNKKRGHAPVSYAKAPTLMAALGFDPYPVARCVEVGIRTMLN